MANNLHPQMLALIMDHQANFERLLRERRSRVLRIIQQSRINLQMMQQAYFQLYLQLFIIDPGNAVMSLMPRIRTIGSKVRSSEWWERDVLQLYDDQQWIEDFRMTKATFFELVDLVRDRLAVDENAMPGAISVEKKVGIAVYKLASVGEYRTVGKGFGVSKSTVCVCVHQFCKAFIASQMHRILHWPSHDECISISQDIEMRNQLPNVIGIIDGTHIPITPPEHGAADFRNRKGYSSIAVQAVVDNKLLFRDVTAKHPGCCHDANVLRGSYLYENHATMIPSSNRIIDGMLDGNGQPISFRLPYYIIGDPAYPLSDWIMKNFPTEETEEEISFNLYLNKIRIVVENAFGRLKGRWRILCKKSDLNVYNMPHIIITCCMLHNFVELHKQNYLPRWDQYLAEMDNEYPQPDNYNINNNDVDGNVMRSHLCAYMARHYPILNRNNNL